MLFGDAKDTCDGKIECVCKLIDNLKIVSHQACTRTATEELNLKPGAIQIPQTGLTMIFFMARMRLTQINLSCTILLYIKLKLALEFDDRDIMCAVTIRVQSHSQAQT